MENLLKSVISVWISNLASLNEWPGGNPKTSDNNCFGEMSNVYTDLNEKGHMGEHGENNRGRD